MIYLFTGTDVDKARRQAFAFVEAARKKSPELTYLRLAKEELSQSAIEQAATASTLFAKRLLVLIDDPFAKARVAEDEENDSSQESGSSVVLENLEQLADSNNAIVILAPKLSNTTVKKIAVRAEKVYTLDQKIVREDSRGFNIALVNALAARNPEKLWLEVILALRTGDAPEAVHGLLHWKARDILGKGSRSWSTDEARALSMNLITLLQNSRRSGLDLSLSLERFALSI